MQQQQQRKLPGYYIKSSIYKPEKMKKEQKDFSYIYEPHAIEEYIYNSICHVGLEPKNCDNIIS